MAMVAAAITAVAAHPKSRSIGLATKRVTLSAKELVIQSAGKPTRLSPIDACFSCAGGARYQGIEIRVSQLGADGAPKEPMFVFNAQEKRGVLVLHNGCIGGPGGQDRALLVDGKRGVLQDLAGMTEPDGGPNAARQRAAQRE